MTVEPIAHCSFCVEGSYRWCDDRIAYGTHTPASRLPHRFGSHVE